MWPRNLVYCSLLVVALLSLFKSGTACSCMMTHPQTHYCDADFVILARIKAVRRLNDTVIYKVRVRKEYKLSEKATVALKSGRILTYSHDSLCGVDMKIGETYAISGRVISLKAYTSLCNLVVPWRQLTRRQRKGLKAIYKHGCNCRILGHKKTPDACVMTYATANCYMKEGICLRQKNGRCNWTRNRMLTGCLKENPLTISRWSG